MKFLFGDIVVVKRNEIGVVVKTWGSINNDSYHYEVYNRMMDSIQEYKENDIERYKVRHKYLNEEELKYQNNYWGVFMKLVEARESVGKKVVYTQKYTNKKEYWIIKKINYEYVFVRYDDGIAKATRPEDLELV